MGQYIDKDALVAEIDRIYYETNYEPFTDEVFGKRDACRKMKDFLNTLEVKEVDFEKELDTWRHNHFHGRRDKEASGEYLERVTQLGLARHFFELGMRVNNPITAADREMAEETIKEVCEWLDDELCCYIKAQDFIIDHARLNEDLRKHLEDEI